MRKSSNTFLKIIYFTLFCLIILKNESRAQYYVSLMPAFYTNAGNTGERLTFDVEFGKQWEVFSLGIDIGKTNLSPQKGIDTTWYTELRSNLNVFQQGRFTNTLTLGAGYVFNAHQNILIETSTGVEYSINKNYHFNIFFGTYFFSGTTSASNNNFFGMSLMYFFHKKDKKEHTN